MFLAGALISVVGLFLYQKWLNSFGGMWAPSRYTSDLQGLERDLGMQMPQIAADIHDVGYAFWQSRILGVRFSMSPNELDDFLVMLGFTGQLQEWPCPFESPELLNEEWWTPSQADEFCGASFTQPEEFYDLMVDKSNPAEYVIYLMVEQG
jgi:hypothetical protein